MTQPSELDTLRAKKAKTPEDFRRLAEAQGILEPEDLRRWLQSEFGLAGGHARCITQLLQQLEGLLSGRPDEAEPGEDFLPLIPQRRAGE